MTLLNVSRPIRLWPIRFFASILPVLLFACVPANPPTLAYETALNAYYTALSEPNVLTQREGLERADQLASTALGNNASDAQMRLLRANIRYARYDALAKPNETSTNDAELTRIALAGIFDLNTILASRPRSSDPMRATVQLLNGKWMFRALIAAQREDAIKYSQASPANRQHAYARVAYGELIAARAAFANRLASDAIDVINQKQTAQEEVLKKTEATEKQLSDANNSLDKLEAQRDAWTNVKSDALDLLEHALVAQANAISVPHEAPLLGRNSRCVLQELSTLRQDQPRVIDKNPDGTAANTKTPLDVVWDTARSNGPGEGALETSNIQSLLNQALVAVSLYRFKTEVITPVSSSVADNESTEDAAKRMIWRDHVTTQLTLARRAVWFSLLAGFQIDPSNATPKAVVLPSVFLATTALIEHGQDLDDPKKPTCKTSTP